MDYVGGGGGMGTFQDCFTLQLMLNMHFALLKKSSKEIFFWKKKVLRE